MQVVATCTQHHITAGGVNIYLYVCKYFGPCMYSVCFSVYGALVGLKSPSKIDPPRIKNFVPDHKLHPP